MTRIRGVIHVCQTGNWKRSFDILLRALLASGLYEATESIDVCIVSDGPPSTLPGFPKMKCIRVGLPGVYERPSLLHLRQRANEDSEEVLYWYLHTKGLRWFGTDREQNVLDWIDLMLHWNVTKWKDAVARLSEGYDAYGCGQSTEMSNHYSGNFWWARGSHLRRLPGSIEPGYNEPELWLLKPSTTKWFCAYKSGLEGGGHYLHPYPKELYIQ